VPRSSAIIRPNLGLYIGQARLDTPSRGLVAGNNFRIQQGKLNNFNLGWEPFFDLQLNGAVLLIDNFFLATGIQILIFATPTDIYQFNEGSETVSFITPRYETGTVDVSAADPAVVTGTGTLWAANVFAGDQISFGAAGETDPTATWYTIDTVDNDTQLTLTTTVAGAPLSSQDYTIRKLFSGDAGDIWQTATFLNAHGTEDRWYATNGVDDVVRWNGTADQVTLLSGLGFSCKALSVYKNMLLYGNIVQSGTALPTTVINSHPGEPENTTTGLASQFVVHNGVDGISAMLPIGDSIAIYSAKTVVLGQFVGEPLVMLFRTVSRGSGPVSGRMVIQFGDYHEFIGSDIQYRFDGASLREINGQVWREIIRTRDPSRIDLGFTHMDEENAEVLWVVPSTTDPGASDPLTPAASAFSEYYLETVSRDLALSPFSKRDFPFTASGFFERTSTLTWADLAQEWNSLTFRWNDQFFSAAFPLNVCGDNQGRLYTFSTSQNADGQPMLSFVRFARRAAVDGRARGLVTRVYPFASRFLTATYDLEVKLGLADYASGPATITSAFPFDITLSSEHFVTPYRRARFFEVQFGTSDGPWEIEGYDVDVVNGGRR